MRRTILRVGACLGEFLRPKCGETGVAQLCPEPYSHVARLRYCTHEHGVEYVKAARAMGLSHAQIIWRHILPNSLTPVITFLPFRMSAAIMALASLDFLGLGVTAPSPSLGQLLLQGKQNLDAWWIAVSGFGVLVVTLLLLTFIGEALRGALDSDHGSQWQLERS